MRILDDLLDPPHPPRLAATIYRSTERHLPAPADLRNTLRRYHRIADTVYWAEYTTHPCAITRHVTALETVRAPLAAAVAALNTATANHLDMAEDLAGFWHRPDIAHTLPSGRVLYQVSYAAWLLTEWCDKLTEAAEEDAHTAHTLDTHLPRPTAVG